MYFSISKTELDLNPTMCQLDAFFWLVDDPWVLKGLSCVCEAHIHLYVYQWKFYICVPYVFCALFISSPYILICSDFATLLWIQIADILNHLTDFMQLPFTRFFADCTSSIPIFHQFVVYNCVIPILYWFRCSFQTLFSNSVLSPPSTFAVVGFTSNGGRLWRTCLGSKSTVRKTGYALEWAQVQPITT
jgi:hypothetical protein